MVDEKECEGPKASLLQKIQIKTRTEPESLELGERTRCRRVVVGVKRGTYTPLLGQAKVITRVGSCSRGDQQQLIIACGDAYQRGITANMRRQESCGEYGMVSFGATEGYNAPLTVSSRKDANIQPTRIYDIYKLVLRHRPYLGIADVRERLAAADLSQC